MRHSLVCLLILIFLCNAPSGVLAGDIVKISSSPSTDFRSNPSDRSGVTEKLSLGDNQSNSNAAWSKGLKIGVNGPIPVIVVDQFGYPTKAPKIAVIRDPQVGYDSVAHFAPGSKSEPQLSWWYGGEPLKAV